MRSPTLDSDSDGDESDEDTTGYPAQKMTIIVYASDGRRDYLIQLRPDEHFFAAAWPQLPYKRGEYRLILTISASVMGGQRGILNWKNAIFSKSFPSRPDADDWDVWPAGRSMSPTKQYLFCNVYMRGFW